MFEFFLNVCVAVVFLILGCTAGIAYGKRTPMTEYCKSAGGEIAYFDDRLMCWDTANNRVIPITVTYPLPTTPNPPQR